ncbi:MAG: hypothetical protein EPO21_15900 [Chloroflexota bacterium]|nr:MAG: hypothetical protein EPO21_15900 [Chloroflexota bacterium]
MLLRRGEARLPKRSVVCVTRIFTVDKTDLGERIGVLSRTRVREILNGIRLVLEPCEVDEVQQAKSETHPLHLHGTLFTMTQESSVESRATRTWRDRLRAGQRMSTPSIKPHESEARTSTGARPV